MTAKKYWLNKIYHDSQETPHNSQGNISWSSSDSEFEELRKYSWAEKRKKLKSTDSTKDWIKPRIPETVMVINHPHIQNPSISNLYELRESPVISCIQLEELSPVLVDTSVNEESSPVIGKKSVLTRIRSKWKKVEVVKQQIFDSPSCSPDLFQTQESQVIDNDSPGLDQQTVCDISQSSNTSGNYSDIMRSSNSSLLITDNDFLYHQPVPRRKRYKKGGLASQLQKTLHLQKSRYSIWQHELYTKKYVSLSNSSEGEIVRFEIINIRKEYGSVLLECEIRDGTCSDIFSTSSSGNIDKLILIVVGATVNNIFNIGSKYKLFPPYRTKPLLYNSKEVYCYFNVNRIVEC